MRFCRVPCVEVGCLGKWMPRTELAFLEVGEDFAALLALLSQKALVTSFWRELHLLLRDFSRG